MKFLDVDNYYLSLPLRLEIPRPKCFHRCKGPITRAFSMSRCVETCWEKFNVELGFIKEMGHINLWKFPASSKLSEKVFFFFRHKQYRCAPRDSIHKNKKVFFWKILHLLLNKEKSGQFMTRHFFQSTDSAFLYNIFPPTFPLCLVCDCYFLHFSVPALLIGTLGQIVNHLFTLSNLEWIQKISSKACNPSSGVHDSGFNHSKKLDL